MLHLDNLRRAFTAVQGMVATWIPKYLYILLVYMIFSSTPPPPPTPTSPQPMQSCDLCCVDVRTSGLVGLGINAFPG